LSETVQSESAQLSSQIKKDIFVSETFFKKMGEKFCLTSHVLHYGASTFDLVTFCLSANDQATVFVSKSILVAFVLLLFFVGAFALMIFVLTSMRGNQLPVSATRWQHCSRIYFPTLNW
jgi:hypothetical protein